MIYIHRVFYLLRTLRIGFFVYVHTRERTVRGVAAWGESRGFLIMWGGGGFRWIEDEGKGYVHGGFLGLGGGSMRFSENGVSSFVKVPDLVRNFTRAGRRDFGSPNVSTLQSRS